MNKTLFCFIGESGSGKSSIVDILKKEYSIPEIISYTARPRRYPEEDSYIFSDEETYSRHKSEDLIFEETEIEGAKGVKYHYWTNKDQYEFNGIKTLVCDTEGYNHVLHKLEDTDIIGIHIKADRNVRYDRLIASSRKSTEKEKIKEANMRLERSKEKFKLIQCDYVVDNNGDIRETLEIVKTIIKSKIKAG